MDELLNLNWFSGDVNGAVFPIVEFIGSFASCVISIVGFLIVVSSILKNATHGLYAVSPKFWDRVYDVKQEGIRSEAATGGGNNQISKFIGTISSFLLSLLPNVKALTDFEKSPMDAKHFFMRSIPVMCVAIFIGVFIYLGYPAQVAGKFSQIGTFTMDMVMDAVDPKAIVESIPTELVLLNYQTENAATDNDKLANQIAKASIQALVGKLTSVGEMTKESKQACLSAIEAEAINKSNTDYVAYADSGIYKWSVTASVSTEGQRTFARQNGQADADGTIVFNESLSLSTLPTGVTFDVSNWYLYYTVVFTPVAHKEVSSVKSATVTLEASKIPYMSANKTVEFDFSSFAGSSTASITLSSGRKVSSDNGCTFKTKSSSGNVLIIELDSYDTNKYSNPTDAVQACNSFTFQKGLWYTIDGSRCTITQITKGGSGCQFSAGGATFSFGDNPANLSSSTSAD